jgi:hypothetical protein
MGLGSVLRIGACWMRLRAGREESVIVRREPNNARYINPFEFATEAKWSKERTLLWQKRE